MKSDTLQYLASRRRPDCGCKPAATEPTRDDSDVTVDGVTYLAYPGAAAAGLLSEAA